jgi:uncharacterized protein YjbI with pentapeptide repeats
MDVQNDTPLALGWVVGKIDPPQWAASFFLKGTFALRQGEAAVWADEPLLLSGDVYADEDPTRALVYPTDFAPFKPRADVVVQATAHAPGGQPLPAFPVSVRVGTVTKRLVVFGKRQWKRDAMGSVSVTGPTPIAIVPLIPESAYGGSGYSRNPLGLGWGSQGAPLVEYPMRPVRGPSDDAEPAGFGPMPAGWPQRAALTGTYDDGWLNARWPWFPTDFDWGYFNAAPRDQQVDGYFIGDEELEFQNLHPEIPVGRGRLPAVRPRCFIEDRTTGGDQRFREVALKLDTVWVDVTAAVMVLVWRGHVNVRTIKLKEVERVVVAVESLSEKPRPADSFRGIVVIDDPPLVMPDAPTADPVAFERASAAMDEELATMEGDFASVESEMAEGLAKAELELSQHKADLIAQGVDPGLFMQPPVDSSSVEAFDQIVAQLRATNPVEAAKADAHRPWISNAERGLTAMDDEMTAMQQHLDAQRAAADADQSKRWTRQSVQEASAAGENLTGENLSELDLSNLVLVRTSLREAVLAKTILRGANMSGSDLGGADLTGANLSGADLSHVNLDGADLTGAILAGARFIGISLKAATLSGVDLSGADLTGCDAARADFAGANLVGAKFDQANLNEADFTGANLTDAHFRRAGLRAAQFNGVKAGRIDCEEADLTGLQGSGASDFAGGNFRRTRSAKASFEESVLDGADFSGAALGNAQFGDASLRGAKFDRADLRGALFDDANLQSASLRNANLLRTSLDRADLTDADCGGSNLYEAGFWDATVERANFSGANLAGTLLRG